MFYTAPMGKRQRARDQHADDWTSAYILDLDLNGTRHQLMLRNRAAVDAFLLDLGSGLHVTAATYNPEAGTCTVRTRRSSEPTDARR
jgi:hypothetical protein